MPRASLRCRVAMRSPAVLLATVAAGCAGVVTMVVCALTLQSITFGYLEARWQGHWEGEMNLAADCAMVITSNGPVCGTNDFEGARAFFNIPFGAAPTGDRRWRQPQPPEPWAKPLNVSAPPAGKERSCLQQLSDGMDFSNTTIVGTEDCLNLIVYTPKTQHQTTRAAPKLPVLVWIHGGGWMLGDAWENGTYNGASLARDHGLVVVSIQYRLGPLGFLALDALKTEDSAQGSTGNYGLADQRFALEWVAANAAAFGGDPGRVTIAGESAGAESVCFHLVSPASAGLFHGAIMQSGSCDPAGDMLTAAEKQELWKKEAHSATGCRWADLACYRSLNGGALMSLVPIIRPGLMFSGGGFTVDGSSAGLPDWPVTLFQQGQFSRVPLIIGTNAHEYQCACPQPVNATSVRDCGFLNMMPQIVPGGLAFPISDAMARELLQISWLRFHPNLTLSNAQWGAVLERYPLQDYAGSPDFRFSAMTTDAGHTGTKEHPGLSANIGQCGTLRVADAVAASGGDVWVYSARVLGSNTWPSHADDLPYLFMSPDLPESAADLAMARTLRGLWGSFVSTGLPTGGAGWPRYRQPGRLIAAFNGTAVDVGIPERLPFCQFWQDLMTSDGLLVDSSGEEREAGREVS